MNKRKADTRWSKKKKCMVEKERKIMFKEKKILMSKVHTYKKISTACTKQRHFRKAPTKIGHMLHLILMFDIGFNPF